MAAYVWNGSTLTINFKEDGADVQHVLNASDLTEQVREAAMRFGLQTVLRNATAGKMDEVQDAIKAQAARLATIKGGAWAEQRATKDAIGLSDDEKNDIMFRVITDAYRMKPGNTRTAQEIITWFNGQDETVQQAVLTALKGSIDKALKAALAARKKAGKASITLPGLPE